MTTMVHLSASTGKRRGTARNRVFFNRGELRQLLDVYSRRVASGEWRDYAIDHFGPAAVFSVFRHSYDAPLFSISKSVIGNRCEYTVFHGRQKIGRGAALAEVLKTFERPLRLVSAH